MSCCLSRYLKSWSTVTTILYWRIWRPLTRRWKLLKKTFLKKMNGPENLFSMWLVSASLPLTVRLWNMPKTFGISNPAKERAAHMQKGEKNSSPFFYLPSCLSLPSGISTSGRSGCIGLSYSRNWPVNNFFGLFIITWNIY